MMYDEVLNLHMVQSSKLKVCLTKPLYDLRLRKGKYTLPYISTSVLVYPANKKDAIYWKYLLAQTSKV